jgi:hypothetical protein
MVAFFGIFRLASDEPLSTQLRRSGAYELVPKPVVAGAYVSTVLDDFSRCVSALVAISLNKGSFLPASLLIVLLP